MWITHAAASPATRQVDASFDFRIEVLGPQISAHAEQLVSEGGYLPVLDLVAVHIFPQALSSQEPEVSSPDLSAVGAR